MTLFGIPDPWIWMAYVGCIACVIFCCAYGFVKGRSNGEEDDEDGS